MAKNIEINVKTANGYELLYPAVNPDILKIDSSNVQVDNTLSEKLGLDDGANLSDMLGKLESGVLAKITTVGYDYYSGLALGYLNNYVSGYKQITYGKGIYYLTNNNKNGWIQNLSAVQLNNPTYSYSGVETTTLDSAIYCEDGYFYTGNNDGYGDYKIYYSLDGKSYTAGGATHQTGGAQTITWAKSYNNILFFTRGYAGSEDDYDVTYSSVDHGKTIVTLWSVDASTSFALRVFYVKDIGYFALNGKRGSSNNITYYFSKTGTDNYYDWDSHILTLDTNIIPILFKNQIIGISSDRIIVLSGKEDGTLEITYDYTAPITWSNYNTTDIMFECNNNYMVFFTKNSQYYYINSFTGNSSDFQTVTLPDNFSYSNYSNLVYLNNEFVLTPKYTLYSTVPILTSTNGKVFTDKYYENQTRLFNMINQELKLVPESILNLDLDGLAKIDYGTYTGSGSTSWSLTTPFDVKLLMIIDYDTSNYSNVNQTTFIKTSWGIVTTTASASTSSPTTKITWTTSKISATLISGAPAYMNKNKTKYYYVMIG